MKNFFQQDDSGLSSQMLLTIDKSQSQRKCIKEPKLYTVTDEYLLNILREQRQSKEEILKMKKQIFEVKEKLSRIEKRSDKEKFKQPYPLEIKAKLDLGKKSFYYSPEASIKSQQKRDGITFVTVKKKQKVKKDHSNDYFDDSLSKYLVKENRNKSNSRSERKILTFNPYDDQISVNRIKTKIDECQEHSSHEQKNYRHNSHKNKNQKNKVFSSQETTQKKQDVTFSQIKKLRKDFDQLASLELRERNIEEKKLKRKQLVKLSHIIDQLENTRSNGKIKRTKSPDVIRVLKW